jgi:hypothetical protein
MRSHVQPFLILLTGLLLVSLSWGGAPPSHYVGFYHWGGAYQASIAEGVEAVAQIGGRIARVAISPRFYIDYHIASYCIANFSLAAAVRDPNVKRALDNDSVDAFILTAYDGSTFGDCSTKHYLNPEYFRSIPEGSAAVVREYSDLTLYLYET